MMAALVGVVGATGMLVAARKTIDSVERVPGVSDHLSAGGSSIENFLLVGSDSRAGADPTAPDASGIGTAEAVSGQRSDTIMILRHDKSTGEAALLSIPRDLWVDVPGHDKKRRINSAFSDGPEVLVQTLQQGDLRIPINHYVEIDFSGFKSLVDALGGVQICVDYVTRDVSTGLDITEPGCHLLQGEQALAYARSRHYEELREDGEWHEDPASDLGRTKRQQQFVNLAVADRAGSHQGRSVLRRSPDRSDRRVAARRRRARPDRRCGITPFGGRWWNRDLPAARVRQDDRRERGAPAG